MSSERSELFKTKQPSQAQGVFFNQHQNTPARDKMELEKEEKPAPKGELHEMTLTTPTELLLATIVEQNRAIVEQNRAIVEQLKIQNGIKIMRIKEKEEKEVQLIKELEEVKEKEEEHFSSLYS
jgi:hypothetical protein